MTLKAKENYFTYIGIAGYLTILFITLWHRQPPLFDEVVFIPNVYLLERLGLTREFLYNIDNQAPGPLYQFIHYPLKPLTHLTTPGIRLVNVVLLGLLVLLLSKILMKLSKFSFSKSLSIAVGIIAVPMVWQVSGLALSEMPTMFFSILSILVLIYSIQSEEKSLVGSSLMAILAGAFLGLSILGRAPFVMIVPATGSLLLGQQRNMNRWRIIILYAATALSISLPVFFIWKGLVPPRQAFVGAGGISLWHGTLAFAYGALLTIIIAPGWFILNKRILTLLGALYLVILVVNKLWWGFTYYPLSEALKKIFPPGFMDLYPYIISPFLFVLGFYFLACSVYRAWEKRQDVFFVFILLCGLLILASTAKVTHLFSTRYVAQAAPFFVLVLATYDKFNLSSAARWIIAMVIGFLSLETYFLFQ